jgi:hypothetical protein
MKRFIWTLILAGAAFGVYRYYPEFENKARQRTGQSSATESAPPASTEPTPIVAPAKPIVMPTKAPEVVAPPPSPQPVAPALDEFDQRYPNPVFPPIEKLVKNWADIPDTVFPRAIVLNVDLKCQLANGAGQAVYPKGSPAVALADENGILVVAPNATSQIRGRLSISDTNLKDVLAQAYKEFQARKTRDTVAMRTKARAEAKERPSAAVVAAGGAPGTDEAVPAAVLAKIGPKPAQNPDGIVPLMQASLKAGKPKEITEKGISAWGPMQWKDIEGEPYWTANVHYTAVTLFGEFPTDAMALIRRGAIVKWIYSGTGEPVP